MIRFSPVPVLILVLLLASCAPSARSDQSTARLPELQAPMVEQAAEAAVIRSFNPPGAGASVTVSVPVTVTNPNPFPLQVHNIQYSRTLGDSDLQSGGLSTENLLLLAHGSHQTTLELTASLSQDTALLSRTAQALTGTGLPFTVEGRTTYSSRSHPWDTTSNFRLSGTAVASTAVLVPELTLVAGETSVFFMPESDGAVVRAVIRISNPGFVGYLVHAKDLTAQLDGQPLASQDLAPTPVAAGQTTTAVLSFTPAAELLTPQAREVLSNALAGLQTELVLTGRIAWDVLGLDSFQGPGEFRLSALLNGN